MKRLLITGADGYLGSGLARSFLQNTDWSLLLWVRAVDSSAARSKTAWLAKELERFGDRVTFAWGDLRDEQPFASVSRNEVGAIVHAAAVTAFNVDAVTAQAVNVDGGRKLMKWARGCAHLQWYSHLSTVYASGLASGLIPEEPILEAPTFGNHYEASKWAAEHALVTEFSDLPWNIFRVATAVAHDETGYVIQSNIVHKILHLMYGGLLPVVAGAPATPLYFVTGEFAIETIRERSCSSDLHLVYNVCHERADCLSFGECIDLAYEAFQEQPGFRALRIMKPLYTEESVFMHMAEHVGMFSQGMVLHAVQLMRPFAKQMFLDKDVQNGRLRAANPSYRAPDMRALLRRVTAELLRTSWGTGAESGASARLTASAP